MYIPTDETQDVQHSGYKCCDTPFIQTSTKTGKNKCAICQKIYKTYIEYYCPKCNSAQKGLSMYNMIKDGRTDWSTCNVCDLDEFPVSYFIKKEEVVFYDTYDV